jgi:hypothetical protein
MYYSSVPSLLFFSSSFTFSLFNVVSSLTRRVRLVLLFFFLNVDFYSLTASICHFFYLSFFLYEMTWELSNNIRTRIRHTLAISHLKKKKDKKKRRSKNNSITVRVFIFLGGRLEGSRRTHRRIPRGRTAMPKRNCSRRIRLYTYWGGSSNRIHPDSRSRVCERLISRTLYKICMDKLHDISN